MDAEFHILMVEDSLGDVLSFRRAMARTNDRVAVQSAMTAEVALACLQRPVAEGPDLCLVDINLPQLSGIDLVKTVKPWRQGLPMMVMSSSDAETDIERAFSAGADGYVVKPFDFREYETIARYVCSRWVTGEAPTVPYRGIILPPEPAARRSRAS